MPEMSSVDSKINASDQSMTKRITSFYDNSSVMITNKYDVCFYGPYVESVLMWLQSESTKSRDSFMDRATNGSKLVNGTAIYQNAFNNWVATHVTSSGYNQVNLKWAASMVKLPHANPEVELTKNSMDAIKPIRYPVVKNSTHGELTIEITDNRNMMWYHFFNSLKNRFFLPQVFRPRSSFQKLGAGIITYSSEDYASLNGVELAPVQSFEFNSIVIKSMSDLTFKHSDASLLTFTVTFSVPNAFQGGFNNTVRGLANNTSTDNMGSFELTDLKTKGNGWYPENTGKFKQAEKNASGLINNKRTAKN